MLSSRGHVQCELADTSHIVYDLVGGKITMFGYKTLRGKAKIKTHRSRCYPSKIASLMWGWARICGTQRMCHANTYAHADHGIVLHGLPASCTCNSGLSDWQTVHMKLIHTMRGSSRRGRPLHSWQPPSANMQTDRIGLDWIVYVSAGRQANFGTCHRCNI